MVLADFAEFQFHKVRLKAFAGLEIINSDTSFNSIRYD